MTSLKKSNNKQYDDQYDDKDNKYDDNDNQYENNDNQYENNDDQYDEEYEEYEDEDKSYYNKKKSSFSLSSWDPRVILYNQVKCFVISIIIFMILIWLISYIPIIGPIMKNLIIRFITFLASMAGVIKC